ncbi:uncharacterized protein LOC129770104 [Toxorhynchites rutilus septentrionalis]|uniref:uncharacterized protein LOC129770104 n=1 Tax=Toxorhynchites rutilus septentrionalis TaxID=329112 RepID=UPI002478894C|nr:uncharacterized protein LOC129770104 [Toxorhynchites rutilus septentrionalis]
MPDSVQEVKDLTTVIQWNCRSIIPKLDQFKFLIHSSNCDVFSLCETWLSSADELNFHDFNIIRLDRNDSFGGVLLGIKKCHSFYRVTLPSMTGIEVVACQTQINGKDLCIASIYIPPRTMVGRHQFFDIIEALPEPRLILGDLNSHGTAWGSLYDDNRATLIYDLCDNFKLTVLNTGEATRIANPPARASMLDISLCSSSLSLDCTWKVIQDPHGSDHLPIILSIANESALVSMHELPPLEEYNFISSLIYESALQAQKKRVPATTLRRRPPSLWWDKECSKVYLEKSSAFKKFRKTGLVEWFRKHQALEAKLKGLIKEKSVDIGESSSMVCQGRPL